MCVVYAYDAHRKALGGTGDLWRGDILFSLWGRGYAGAATVMARCNLCILFVYSVL